MMHNENDMPVIDFSLCTNCGACAEVCPEGVLAIGETHLEVVQPEACTDCADCEVVCPTGAIRNELEISWGEA
jgi:NAD-dependent dihydropyrimidine dehydrogenase PreA subunit